MQHHQQQQQQHMHHHHQQQQVHHQSDIERMDPGTKSEGEEDSQQGTIKAKATLGRTPNHLTLRFVERKIFLKITIRFLESHQ